MHQFLKVLRTHSAPQLVPLLFTIGFEEHYIEDKLQLGVEFELLVFPMHHFDKQSDNDPIHITWDGVEHVLKIGYSSVAPLVLPHVPAMRNMSFAEIQAQATETFHTIRKRGKTDPCYLNLINLGKANKQQLTLVEARAFLFFELGMRDLFKVTAS